MARSRGIQKRWMINSIGAVLLIVLLAVGAFSIAISGYYYSSIASGLEAKVTEATNYLINNCRTEAEYQQAARVNVETFAGKDRIELQFLNPRGWVEYSSYGLISGSIPDSPDIRDAIESRSLRGWSGISHETNQRIMAVSAPVVYEGTIVGVMRMVTALTLVDRQVITIIGVAVLIGIVILLMVYFSNLFFVRSIIEPVVRVTEAAKRIASGSYGIQLEKQFDDEIGDLTDAINDMSLKVNQTEKIKSEFISSVSHELRTPLTAINGWAETIMNGEVQDANKGLGIIVSEARRLTNMVEELLEFSRIEDGRFTLSIEPVDIKAELEDAVYTYQEFFRREGITLTHADCEEEFPPIEGDPERLRQVFCNLLDNAAKHGGIGKRIDTAIVPEKSEDDDEWVVIRVRDYGPGIPEDELPHVKYKFYKGSSKTRGSGIGLAVCEEIIARHGGTLGIGNAAGGGCEVVIRLPVTKR